MKLYLVSLVDRSGAMLAGAHFLAADAAQARAIGLTYLTAVPAELPPAMAESIRAKLAGFYVVSAKPSKAALCNAVNRDSN